MVSKAVPEGIVLHQIKPRGRLRVVQDILATDPADTAIDVSCELDEIDVLPVLDAARRFSGLTLIDLTAAVERARGRGGLVNVRRWVPYADGRSESPMESRTRYRIISAGLPPPEPQIEIHT